MPDSARAFSGNNDHDRTTSTIGREKRENPRPTGKGREAFIAIMNGLDLSRPKRIDLAVPANRECGMPQG